jgi:hypothetical protein
VQQLRTPASVPHGLKVAQPGEGVTYYATNGQKYTWNGDTIAKYNERLNEATKIVEAAKQSIQNTETALADAESRIRAIEKGGGGGGKAISDDKIAEAAIAGIKKLTSPPFNGRDLIVPGTLDVRQLNVTEKLAAEIVSAMSAETKKLVVTEDAILQRATVIENIVTPELIAKKIQVEQLASQIITSGLLQTSIAHDQGVKINAAGIQAFDANGMQQVKIDASGKDNYFIGTLRTAREGRPGVKIWTTEPEGPADSVSSVIEMRPHEVTGSTPNGVIHMHPQGWFSFGMRNEGDRKGLIKGLSVDQNGGVNITEALRVRGNVRINGLFTQTENFFHIPVGDFEVNGGGWRTWDVKFPYRLEQKPYVIAQAVTDFALVATVSDLSETGCKLIVNNASRAKATNSWVDIIVLPLRRER